MSIFGIDFSNDKAVDSARHTDIIIAEKKGGLPIDNRSEGPPNYSQKRTPGSFSVQHPQYNIRIDPRQTYHLIRLATQYTAYPTPRPNGNMIHGRHKGVSLNFQAKIPTARMPKITPMIWGSMYWFPSLCHLAGVYVKLAYSYYSVPKPIDTTQLTKQKGYI